MDLSGIYQKHSIEKQRDTDQKYCKLEGGDYVDINDLISNPVAKQPF